MTDESGPKDDALAPSAAWDIEGVIAQSLVLRLTRGEQVWASRGSIVSTGDGISWHLKVPGGMGAAVGRAFAGEGLALTRITSERDGGRVVLGAGQPGKIETWDLEHQGDIVCTRGSFLAARGDIDIIPTVAKRAGAAVFGGAGLILQRIKGSGTAFLHGSGDFVKHELEPGETLQVSTGNLAAFAASVDYGIAGVKGCRNMLFGGEGLFMARLTGPGIVYLQSLKRLPAGRRGGGG